MEPFAQVSAMLRFVLSCYAMEQEQCWVLEYQFVLRITRDEMKLHHGERDESIGLQIPNVQLHEEYPTP